MKLMTKDDILSQIVNRAKELNPYSQFDYYYENEDIKTSASFQDTFYI